MRARRRAAAAGDRPAGRRRAQHLPGQALRLLGARVLRLDGREHAHGRVHRQGRGGERRHARRRAPDDDPADRRGDLVLPRDRVRDPHRDRRLGALGGDDRVHVHGAAVAGRAPARHGRVRRALRRRCARPRCSPSWRCSSAWLPGRRLRRGARAAGRRVDLVRRHRDGDRGAAAHLAREGRPARLHRPGHAARRLRRLLPGRRDAGLDAVAVASCRRRPTRCKASAPRCSTAPDSASSGGTCGRCSCSASWRSRSASRSSARASATPSATAS